MFSWKTFQLFHPIGGVLTKSLICEKAGSIATAVKRMDSLILFILFSFTFYKLILYEPLLHLLYPSQDRRLANNYFLSSSPQLDSNSGHLIALNIFHSYQKFDMDGFVVVHPFLEQTQTKWCFQIQSNSRSLNRY